MAKETPCDYMNCPYDAAYSRDCEYYCGLGRDEDPYPTDDDRFLDELMMEQKEQM